MAHETSGTEAPRATASSMTASQSWACARICSASAAAAAAPELERLHRARDVRQVGEGHEELGVELREFASQRPRAHLEFGGGFPHGNDVVRVNLVHGARDGGRHCFAPPATESERGLVDDDEAGVDVGGELRESLSGSPSRRTNSMFLARRVASISRRPRSMNPN